MKATSLVYLPLFSAFIILSGCGGGKSSSSKKNIDVSENNKCIVVPDADTVYSDWSKENIVVNQWPSDPDNLHPTNGRLASRSWVLQYTSNFLLRNDPVHLTVTPDLAVAMPEISADGLKYKYEMRTDAKWDDGSTITAEDVIFTMKANSCELVNNPQAKPYFENISTIEFDPSHAETLTIVMKKKYILNAIFLADYPIMERNFFDKQNILSHYSFDQLRDTSLHSHTPDDLSAWATEFNDPKYGSDVHYLNGSGPYKVSEWSHGDQLILEKKQNHWTSQIKDPDVYHTAYPDKIIFKINKDDDSQKLEFKAQHYDVSVWLSTDVAVDLLNDANFRRNYNLEFTDGYTYNFLAMNMKPDGIQHKKIFTDAKTRRAMALLTPVDDMINVISHGYGKRQASMVAALKPDYNSDLKLLPLDINAAMQLLDEAGWKDTDGDGIRDKVVDGEKIPLRFSILYNSAQKISEQMAKMAAESMQKAGVDVTWQPLDNAALSEKARTHDFDMLLSAWGGGPFPEDYTQLWSTDAYTSGGSNFVGYGNAATDALIDSIKYTLDDNVRIPMVKRLQKILYDDQPYVFLYAGSRKNVMHKRFGNQYMTFDRPGVVMNNLRLLSLYGSQSGASIKEINPQ